MRNGLLNNRGNSMNCEYCDGDSDGYVKFLPKALKGFNASVHKGSMNEVKLLISGAGQKGSFNINFCPMCGKKLID